MRAQAIIYPILYMHICSSLCLSHHRAVGIALLVVILAGLLLLGCWYFKKRSSYKILRVRTFHSFLFKRKLYFLFFESFLNIILLKVKVNSSPPPQ
uniref:Uncharacterized protein n=1 Tax=Gouania willdenowi TaxID=441366 RepID=A0A8C5DZE2_GOUWI